MIKTVSFIRLSHRHPLIRLSVLLQAIRYPVYPFRRRQSVIPFIRFAASNPLSRLSVLLQAIRYPVYPIRRRQSVVYTQRRTCLLYSNQSQPNWAASISSSRRINWEPINHRYKGNKWQFLSF
jgi:hypothetical protein